MFLSASCSADLYFTRENLNVFFEQREQLPLEKRWDLLKGSIPSQEDLREQQHLREDLSEQGGRMDIEDVDGGL